MKYFEVFKAGNYPQGKFTKAEVEELAKNYDPSFCEAPITLDHEQSGPAYGWVDNLKSENGILKASFKDLSEDLKEFVGQGKYKKISIEIYRELEGKKPYLKAVSFLGASIPQVKGMQAVEFKEGESDVYTFEVQIEDDDENIDDLKAQIATLSEQVADFKEKRIASRERNGQGDEPCREDSFSASNQVAKKNTEIKDLKSQVKDLNLQLAKFKDEAAEKDELIKELKDIKDNLRNKDFNEFIDKQIEAGILTPSNKDTVLNILEDLDDVKKFDESSNGVDLFKEFVSKLPKQIEFDEIAKKKATQKIDVEKYADADEESVEIYKQASEIAEKEKISFREALLKVKEV